MPTPESLVQFKAGLQSAFDLIVDKDLNTVYFVTDTQRLFVGETEYTRPVQHGTALPEGYNPPNSLFVLETGSVRDLYYSTDGASWTQIAHLPASITGGVFGSATQVPKITVDANGAVTAIENVSIEFPSIETDITVEGNDSAGNVITGVSAEGRTITVTKGTMLDQTTADGRYAQLSGAAFTGNVTVPTTPAGNSSVTAKTYVDTQDAATLQDAKDYADSILGANDAMVYKGTVGTGGTVTDFSSLTDYQTGWTYRVITAGTYAGVDCEIGDLLIAVADYSDAFKDADWTVAQTNIDGAVISNAALVSGNIVTGAGGQNVQDSGVSLSSLQTTISGKLDKATGSPVSGNIVEFGADGAIVDSGVATDSLATSASVSAVADDVAELQSGKVDKTTTVAGKPLSSNVTIALDDLSDVTISDPAEGNGLVYNGTTWVNGPVEADSVTWGNVTSKPTISFTGDASGSINLQTGNSGTLTLGSVGTAGTYVKVTTDVKGRVTSGETSITTEDISDMPTTLPNPNALTIGGKTYDGSAAVSVTTTDLGLRNGTIGATVASNTATITLNPTLGSSSDFTISTANSSEIVIGGTPDAITIGLGTAISPTKIAVGALANGMTATTQAASDNSTKIATTAYVTTAVSNSSLKWGSF